MSRSAHACIVAVAVAVGVLGVPGNALAQVPVGVFADVKNVGPEFNSSTTDSSAEISPDGLALLFHSHRSTPDIYRATRASTNEPFGNVERLGFGADAGAPSFSSDGLTLFFHAADQLGGSGRFDLYQATRATTDESFSNVTNLGPNVNSASNEFGPEITSDGLMLLISSERSGGAGGLDIWVTTRPTTADPFGTTINLNDFFPGSDVNSRYGDGDPSISTDGLVLFFSDDPPFLGTARPGGKGDADIWVATRETTNSPFATPVNLNDLWPGSQVNGPKSDWEPSLSADWPADGAKLYFTSDRAGSLGGFDIWQATWFVVSDDCGVDLVSTMGGIGADFAASAAGTFISPVDESVPLDRFTFEATEDLTLNVALPVYTGPIGGGRRGSGLPKVPEVTTFTALTDGQYLVELDPPPAPGQWLKLTLNVTVADSGCRANLNFWLAHHPGDINQDGVVNIRDATAFGEEFRGRMDARLIDLNGDGVVDIRDATTFGDIWRGAGEATKAWEGHELPPKPE